MENTEQELDEIIKKAQAAVARTKITDKNLQKVTYKFALNYYWYYKVNKSQTSHKAKR